MKFLQFITWFESRSCKSLGASTTELIEACGERFGGVNRIGVYGVCEGFDRVVRLGVGIAFFGTRLLIFYRTLSSLIELDFEKGKRLF